MHKINLGFILAILWYFWHYTSEGVMGPPHTPKIQILKVTLECASPIQIHLWYKLSFLWKFQPDWPTLRGVLGWSGILWLPRQLHSLNLHFGLDTNFSKNKLLKFISGATPVGNKYGFQPWIYLNWEYISISLYSHLWLYFRLPGPHMTHKTPLVYQM